MRGTLLFAGALLLIAFIALVGQTTSVAAVGAPTENYTMPNIPTSDQSSPEIKPPVNYVWQGPTSQPQSTPPGFIPAFIGASPQDRSRVTADENWYLNVDINAPGWLYIYEYFSIDKDFQGEWIAYNWQLLESGLWRLGPFIPGDSEAEGQHIYRIWFYSDGQWAAEDSDAPQHNLVYWTYVKGQPAEQVPQQPPALVKKTTFLDQIYKFITMPVVLFGFSALVVIGLGLYLFKIYASRRRTQGTSLPAGIGHEDPSAMLQSTIASAKIALTNGLEIGFTGNRRVIGRGDLARVLGLDDLGLISRRHFEIKYEQEQFYIEDMGSTNGTRLNGVDIKGKGPMILNDDDVIEPAGTISVKFYIL
jgi:hypothetical protein